jgi:hypothetical protein
MEGAMREVKVYVPTYYGALLAKQVAKSDEPEFGAPLVPLFIRDEDGLRVLLGAPHRDRDEDADILIERRPNGWAIFLHPLTGCDPIGCVYFLDDGRSFLAKELPLGPTPAIQVLESHESVPGIDDLRHSKGPPQCPPQEDRTQGAKCDDPIVCRGDGQYECESNQRLPDNDATQ